jgi:hypothetical protein
MKPHRATLILVLGVLSLIFCQFLGIAAWIMGNGDLKEMAAGAMDPAGKDMTNIGRILGIISTVLLIIGVVAVILLSVLGGLGAIAGASSAG